jgi:hypothetical protein
MHVTLGERSSVRFSIPDRSVDRFDDGQLADEAGDQDVSSKAATVDHAPQDTWVSRSSDRNLNRRRQARGERPGQHRRAWLCRQFDIKRRTIMTTSTEYCDDHGEGAVGDYRRRQCDRT